MKKLFLLSLGLSGILIASAQSSDGNFRPFRVDVDFGYALPPGGAGAKDGFIFSLEPKYAVMDELQIGLRIEAAVMTRGYSFSTGTAQQSGTVSAAASYTATGDYYFSNDVLRPFVGAGIGIFSVASASFSDYGNSSSAVAASQKPGGMIRAGFEANHFRLGIEYNLIGNSSITTADSGGNPIMATSRNSYLGIKLGFFIGGGRLD
jgi:hypothetical protein